jgi:hypothetical protein
MLKLLHLLLRGGSQESAPATDRRQVANLPVESLTSGDRSFSIKAHLSREDDFPILNWDAAQNWIGSVPDAAARGEMWTQIERAWLQHMQANLGRNYSLRETETAFLLSTLESNIASVTLDFMSKTLQRVVRVLDGIAEVPEWGKDILIVFDDDDTYYRYVSLCYPDSGEFAASGGMYINAGCGHFVTVKADLRTIEPVIAHEMTHSCLGHLPIPAWLNEGLAVNTEQRLCPTGAPMFTPQQMHAKHRAFWGETEIQEFWSGKSFLRNDDGNMLSYDLARILVSQLSRDWSRFRKFVLNANAADAGAVSAAKHLNLELGVAVSALLEQGQADTCAPIPSLWENEAEHGAS